MTQKSPAILAAGGCSPPNPGPPDPSHPLSLRREREGSASTFASERSPASKNTSYLCHRSPQHQLPCTVSYRRGEQSEQTHRVPPWPHSISPETRASVHRAAAKPQPCPAAPLLGTTIISLASISPLASTSHPTSIPPLNSTLSQSSPLP